ncbi:hypothetical protein A1O7_00870 [Cladophialophora yegresii CBS 114405]|uniref:Uncharacterized protein n=1 Tax=Cladophialophora yegresii CBS 114405 TaxID=1182544 RepID=W9X211_9EURO|nr:uncharacterized protein A1O7_00870 [Cladophialophora yegresii CBS 114405]EXJ64534.1 hypothetical protein A1O7_00870 [Cladophialophora yegresii CBS 114405]
MRQITLPDGKRSRLGYPSRTLLSSSYRTLLVSTTKEGQPRADTTLQNIIFAFNSSTVCRATLKDKLRHIIIRGAFKAWKPSASDTPASVGLHDLFYQDITAAVLDALSQQFFSSFSSFETVTPRPPTLAKLYRQYDTVTIDWYDYKCDACKRGKYDYCREYLENYGGGRRWCNVEQEQPWGHKLKRCHTCVTIVGVIKELNALVFREPWLVTEGVAGAPQKEAWEMEGEDVAGIEEEEDAVSDPLDGLTAEERGKLRHAAMEAVMRRWSLMAAEQAAETEAK